MSKVYGPDVRLETDEPGKWHAAVNRFMDAGRYPGKFDEFRWMYDAVHTAQEVPRLAVLFSQERTGGLPKNHKQCSRSETEPLPENFLTCCLGKRCSTCPALAAIDLAEMSAEAKDKAKAWTCAAHIVARGGDIANEGYLLTESDKIFWSRLHRNMAAAHGADEHSDGGKR